MMSTQDAYYIPAKATWPIAATLGFVTTLIGFANYLNGNAAGATFMLLGLGIFTLMLIVIGIAPWLISGFIQEASQVMLDNATYIQTILGASK